MKIDIRTTYDSVEWEFLRMMRLEFGLSSRMVDWIVTCVSTMSYSILISGTVIDKIQAKKGLKTGRPHVSLHICVGDEIFKRSPKQLRHVPNFNYHPKCAKLKLVLRMFGDDLIICCREYKISIQLNYDVGFKALLLVY